MVKAVNGRLRPFLWFALYTLIEAGAGSRNIRVSTTELAKRIGGSQQSASRYLQLLESKGLLTRHTASDGSRIRITDEGMEALGEIFYTLKRCFDKETAEDFVFEGVVFNGLHEGAYYICQGDYRAQIKEKLGFDPYPGTLNLRLKGADVEKRKLLEGYPNVALEGFKGKERAFGSARCYPLLINDTVEGALIVADRTSYDVSVMEIIAPVYLRKYLSLKDGDTVKVSIIGVKMSLS